MFVGLHIITKLFQTFSVPPIAPLPEYIAPPSQYRGRRATFQRAMKLTIFIGQCFGIFPVLGASDLDTSKLRFVIYDFTTHSFPLFTTISHQSRSGFLFKKSYISKYGSYSQSQSQYVTMQLTNILVY